MNTDLSQRIRCDTCPRCKDVYPGKVDMDGYHYCICGMSGNIVYKIPHKIRRYSGKGYVSLGISSCGLYESVEDALKDMTKAEIKRWRYEHDRGFISKVQESQKES